MLRFFKYLLRPFGVGRIPTVVENKVAVAYSRATEKMIKAHIGAMREFVGAMESEVPLFYAIDLYVQKLWLPDALATIVVTRFLVDLSNSLPLAYKVVSQPKPRNRMGEARARALAARAGLAPRGGKDPSKGVGPKPARSGDDDRPAKEAAVSQSS